ncbi:MULTISPECIES: SDR family oxidoreductase [Cryobacterium]|uniref:SDR family oxidoreductase n=1 Tax=Cryobacterium TaxID=69578 RepID=UPI0018E086AB|nr:MULTISPECIES: SDR family oxidoreductase [Cryobacterium]
MTITDLTGKVAVVTGSSRGIGRAIAIRLGARGAQVVVNYAHGAQGAAETVAAIIAAGSDAVAVQADVSDPGQIEALFDAARSRFGGIDIVVANAGIDETGGPIVDVTEADYDRMFGVNAKGAFFTLQHAARTVNRGGSIVLIGSGSTSRPVAGFGLYASSKLVGNYLVGVLAQEIGEREVTVNTILASATDGAGYFSAGADNDELRTLVQNASPLGRMGSVDDVSDAVEFFIGPLSRWVSGAQLLVSGGQN